MRVAALQVLYEVDSVRRDPELAFERLLETWPLEEGPKRAAVEIVRGVIANCGRLDELIAKHAPSWPVHQLAIVDRNILRVAMYEMIFDRDTPVKVAINEGVEVAKAFGAEGTPGFVNGVLGAVYKEESAEGPHSGDKLLRSTEVPSNGNSA
jgi:N utilization substance protein B